MRSTERGMRSSFWVSLLRFRTPHSEFRTCSLSIRVRHHDQLVQTLQRLAVIPEFDCQPIEQLGMRRQLAHAAEVVWRLNDPAAEMILPNAIDDTPPRERIAAIGQPFGQRGAAKSLFLSREHTCSRGIANRTSIRR